MAGALPNGIRTSDLKSRMLHLAQTSVFQVKINPPPAVVGYLNERGVDFSQESPRLELLCRQVDLPGSYFNTFDVKNNYSGVTETMIDRRIHGPEIQMQFYVDRDYRVMDIFDGWQDWMSNQTNPAAYKNEFVPYRMNYPSGNSGYRGQVFITKFEKDAYGTADGYTLIGAYPSNIVAAQVSYDQSQIMQYTVVFRFMRYVKEKIRWKPENDSFFNGGSLTPEFFANFNRSAAFGGNNTRPGRAN